MSLIDPSPRPIGSFDVGPIGFGCWRFTNDSIDTASDWGGTGFGLNEEILGKVQADALQAHLEFAIATDQPQFSLLHTDPIRDGTLDRAMEAGTTPLAWSPLAGGALATGEGLPDELVTLLDSLADREGTDRAGIALAWILAHPSRPVALVGTQSPSRLSTYVAAQEVSLDRVDVYALLQAAEGVPLP